MSYPTKLRELAESLRECEWNHPIDAASTCENAADMIQKYTEMLISYIGLLDDTGYSDEARDVERWIDVWEQVEDKPVTDNDLVDRLAEWCRLSERGWRRDPESGVLCEPEWVRDVPGGVRVWHPLDSDDDCRVVLEECQRQQMLSRLTDELTYIWLGQRCIDRDLPYWEWLITATPAEKCAAVARVLWWL